MKNRQDCEDLPTKARQCYVYTLAQPSGHVSVQQAGVAWDGADAAVKIPSLGPRSTTVTSRCSSGWGQQ